jgi:hypothetical protein
MIKQFVVLFLCSQINSLDFDACSSISSKCKCVENNKLVVRCVNFTSFSDLKFRRLNATELDSLELKPSRQLLLDTSLDLGKITRINNFIAFHNLRGFLLGKNPFEKMEGSLEFNLFESSFKFFESPFQELNSKCNLHVFITNQSLFNNSLLSKFRSITLDKTVKYSNKFCPLVFQNSRIESLTLKDLNESNFLNFNQLSFRNYENEIFNFSMSIENLYLFNSNLKVLNESLLNKLVFSGLRSIQIYGELSEIQPQLFGSNFKNLRKIVLDLFNFDDFMRNENSDWMRSLGFYGNESSKHEIILQLNDRNEVFSYENKDICIFKHFPVKNRVYPIIKTKQNLSCSCTLLWLIQSYKNFMNKSQIQLFRTKSVENCLLSNQSFIERTQNCNLERKITNCKGSETENINTNLNFSADMVVKQGETDNSDKTMNTFDNHQIRTLTITVGMFGIFSISTVMGVILYIFR